MKLRILAVATAAFALALTGCDTDGIDSPHPSYPGPSQPGPSNPGPTNPGPTNPAPPTPPPSSGTFIKIPPPSTFLRLSDDPGAMSPIVVQLSSLGIQPGGSICFTAVGDYFVDPGVRVTSTGEALVTAVFSGSDRISDGSSLMRVKDAIHPVNLAEYVTLPTDRGGFPTDFKEDFDATSVCTTVPAGALYVVFGTEDSYATDNASIPGVEFGVHIKK